MKKLKLKVSMHCASCAVNIKKTLKKINVKSVANPALKIVKCEYDDSSVSSDDIIKAIEGIGYNVE